MCKSDNISFVCLFLGFSAAIFSFSKNWAEFRYTSPPTYQTVQCKNNSIFYCLKTGLEFISYVLDFSPFHSRLLFTEPNLFGWHLRQKWHQKHGSNLSNSRSHLASRQIFSPGKINKGWNNTLIHSKQPPSTRKTKIRANKWLTRYLVIYIYIYIYIERERDYMHIYVYIYIWYMHVYIYIYIYIYIVSKYMCIYNVYRYKCVYINYTCVYIDIYTCVYIYHKCVYVIFMGICIYILAHWLEYSAMFRETLVQSQVESYQRLQKTFLIFGMSRLEIEPRSPTLLANTLCVFV